MDVFVLWHVHKVSGRVDAKLIGVYSSPESAEQTRQRIASLPDFRNDPTEFVVDRYSLDQDRWTTGFTTDTQDQLPRESDGTSEPIANPVEHCPVNTWVVWRIDDNGNTFAVRRNLTHEEATRLAAEFEARGHKQMYWVERDG